MVLFEVSRETLIKSTEKRLKFDENQKIQPNFPSLAKFYPAKSNFGQ